MDRIARLSPEKRALLELMFMEQGASSTKEKGITRRETSDPCPLSFAQQRLWFLDQYESGSSFYNLPFALRFKGSLNVKSMERSFAELILRHESLQTVFLS